MSGEVWVGAVYVVEFAEEGGEGDVAVVVEGGVAEDEDAVLGRFVRSWVGSDLW